MNQNLATRAGYAGSMTTGKLKDIDATTNGFGVFAYYTGTNTYNAGTNWKDQTTNDDASIRIAKQSNTAANFMFNQQVKWNADLGDSYITKWTYTPLKYWPNEVQATAYSYSWVDKGTTAPTGTDVSATVTTE